MMGGVLVVILLEEAGGLRGCGSVGMLIYMCRGVTKLKLQFEEQESNTLITNISGGLVSHFSSGDTLIFD